MKKFLSITLMAVLCSCATGGKLKKTAISQDQFDSAWDGHTPSSKIKDAVTVMNGLEFPMASGISVGAWVTPKTRALIEAEQTEAGTKRLDSPEQIKATIADRMIFQKNTCFSILLRTTEIDDAMFKYWTIKVKDSAGNLLPTKTVDETGVESVPEVDSYLIYSFSKVSLVCVGKKVDLSKGFELYMIPERRKDIKAMSFTWSVGAKQ